MFLLTSKLVAGNLVPANRPSENDVSNNCRPQKICFQPVMANTFFAWLTVRRISSSASRRRHALPIDTAFSLPSPIPTWPAGTRTFALSRATEYFRSERIILEKSGGGFAKGSIDIGGLEVCHVSTFNKVWATQNGGPDNLGAAFFAPSLLPPGFFALGFYAQPNNKQLFGSVLAGKDLKGSNNSTTLKAPVDYTLIWSSQDGAAAAYFWLPAPPNGYKAVGYVVTNSSAKPSVDAVRCVREDFTDQCENDAWIWGNGDGSVNFYTLRPATRGAAADGVSAGTFVAQLKSSSPTLSCLKNNNAALFAAMPRFDQIQALIKAYSPVVYLHPDEPYLPSSVSWFFSGGALLYKNDGSPPRPIAADGSNLPQGGANDGSYWIDLPSDSGAKEIVKKGNLESLKVYLHVKPMIGATFTDIAIWVFYPFNGPATAKVDFIKHVSLGRIGEHVGDWEHVTLRISNFNGELKKIYYSEHSAGKWVDASELEFVSGNKPAAYASLNGHAFFPNTGLVLQGNTKLGIGIRNDMDKGQAIDVEAAAVLVAAEYLGAAAVAQPPWLEYGEEWGPKISYDIAEELKKVEKFLPGNLKKVLENVVRSLPEEVLGEEGPTGPKVKSNWSGDEVA